MAAFAAVREIGLEGEEGARAEGDGDGHTPPLPITPHSKRVTLPRKTHHPPHNVRVGYRPGWRSVGSRCDWSWGGCGNRAPTFPASPSTLTTSTRPYDKSSTTSSPSYEPSTTLLTITLTGSMSSLSSAPTDPLPWANGTLTGLHLACITLSRLTGTGYRWSLSTFSTLSLFTPTLSLSPLPDFLRLYSCKAIMITR